MFPIGKCYICLLSPVVFSVAPPQQPVLEQTSCSKYAYFFSGSVISDFSIYILSFKLHALFIMHRTWAKATASIMWVLSLSTPSSFTPSCHHHSAYSFFVYSALPCCKLATNARTLLGVQGPHITQLVNTSTANTLHTCSVECTYEGWHLERGM